MPEIGRLHRVVSLGLLVATMAGPVPELRAQQQAPIPGQEVAREREGARFRSFDVGFGVAFPDEGSVGISYGVGVDIADLVVRGAAVRLGFRFWATEDTQPDGRVVDIDDTVFTLVLKKSFALGRVESYAGLGVAAHIVSGRFEDFADEDDERDGFRPGLEGIAGLELPVADRGFVSVFAEGQGSLLADLPHGSLHVGVRIRFDRLGTGG